MTPRRADRVALLAVALALGGCTHYVVASPEVLAPGSSIRVRLSEPLSFDLPALTAHDVARVDAELVREERDSLIVSALWLDAVSGRGFPGGGWTVVVPERAIDRLEARRLSVWRTAVVVAGGALATYWGFDALGVGGIGGRGAATGGRGR